MKTMGAGAANALYVPCILGCFTIAERPTLGCLAAWLLAVLLATLACKLLLEGPHTFPQGLRSWNGLMCLGMSRLPVSQWGPHISGCQCPPLTMGGIGPSGPRAAECLVFGEPACKLQLMGSCA